MPDAAADRPRHAGAWLAVPLAGALLVVLLEATSVRTHDETFDGEASGVGPLESVAGAPFPRGGGAARMTAELAHLRVPYERTGFGKALTLETTFALEDADVLEVGIRRSDFWLDVVRVPLQHRVLDTLASDDSGWTVLRGDSETVFLNPAYDHTASSVNAFLSRPPTDGVIGLYGNTTLPCGGGDGICRTAPLTLTSDPKDFRAIYARYVPGHPSAPRTSSVTFPLHTVYQHPDGSLDMIFFAGRADDGAPTVRVEAIRVTIAPAAPAAADIAARARRAVRDRIFREPPP